MTNNLLITNSNSQILIKATEQLGIKVELVDPVKVKLRLSQNGREHIVTSKSFGVNSTQAITLTKDKSQTTKLLAQLGIPIPKEILITDPSQIDPAKLPPFPLVIKPTQGQKGHDVYVGVQDLHTAQIIILDILTSYSGVLVQEQVQGTDTRFFVLNNQLIGMAQRHPATLTGDGIHTIKQLIDLHNQTLVTNRQKTGTRLQNRLLNWPRLTWHIQNQGFSMDTILPKNQILTPHPISNFQAGGTVTTIPISNIHPDLKTLVETIAQKTGLTVCGVDMIIKDCTQPPQNNATFIEINSDPSLRLHEWPNHGTPQPVATNLLEFIFRSE